MLTLETPVQYVKGIGPSIAKTLAEKNVLTVEDLLLHLPFRYEDRLNPRPLSDLHPGETVSVIAEIRGAALLRTRSMPIFEMTVGQGISTLKCIWFHGSWLEGKFHPGQLLALYGKVEASRSGRGCKMIQPQIEVLPQGNDDALDQLLEVGRITPVYESLGGSRLASRWIRRVIWNILEDLRSSSATATPSTPNPIPETLPAALLQRLGLSARAEALRAVHFPPAGTSLIQLQSAATPAHRRLIFEELFYLELGLAIKRRKFQERAGVAFQTGETVRAALRSVLPFHPTSAQKRALGEIASDMRRPAPMRRLLQGDVGSGKTIVALQAMLIAIENGYQAALMAPTEILATQHYLSARRILEKSAKKYRITLLTGSLDDDLRRTARRLIVQGEADLIIGTHALIEENVEFASLGLVVVDEQHRFGVLQRFRLMKKDGREPDVLVMTATPIPRTLALSLYGDLDLSILDELPPGRTPIVTRQVPDSRSEEVWTFVRQQVAQGHQAYVVYPVIEGPKDDQPEIDFVLPEEAPEEPAPKKRASKKTAPKQAPLYQPTPPGCPTTARSSQMCESTNPSQPPLREARIAGRAVPALYQGTTSVVPKSATKKGASAPEPSATHAAPKERQAFALKGHGFSRAVRTATKKGASAPEGRPAKSLFEKEKLPLKSATDMYDRLRSHELAGLRIGLLHGRLSADDKEVVMRRFQRGDLDVLIATTVIEVGVDVPNATVMVIEHAERFGIAQLHQLRGRVGRGAAKSWCLLLTGARLTPVAEERLAAMVRTQDGFELAEIDLALRGPGEFFGTRQAGLPSFRVANLVRDRHLLELAKQEAERMWDKQNQEATPEEKSSIWTRLKGPWQRRYGLIEAG